MFANIYFIENFCIGIHQRYWPIIFFLFFHDVSIWFWYQGDDGFTKCLWECCFLSIFLGRGCEGLGLHGGSAGKDSACSVGDLGSIPGLGRCPGEGKGHPLQCSGLESPVDCTVHGAAESRRWLSDFHFTFSSLKDWYQFFFSCLVEFTFEALCSWIFFVGSF